MIVEGENVLRTVQELLRGSRTFRVMYAAMQNAPASRVTYTIREGNTAQVLRFSGGLNGTGYTINGYRGSTSMVNSQAAGEEQVAHEFLHGAGNAAGVIGSRTGVPGACADHNHWNDQCNQIMDRIANEMAASRAREANKKKEEGEQK